MKPRTYVWDTSGSRHVWTSRKSKVLRSKISAEELPSAAQTITDSGSFTGNELVEFGGGDPRLPEDWHGLSSLR